MQLEATNQHLNFTPPPFQFLVGGIDFAPFITSLSLSRPIADISTPLAWTGTVELAEPAHYALLPESLDDLENPRRWARGMFPIQLCFKGVLFATLRILEYYYDEETRTAQIQVGDLLALLNDEAPAKDYKGLGFSACQSVSLSHLVWQALRQAGFRCVAVNIPGSITVPPNKPSGSWVQWVQQYLGERGYWLYLRPNECVNAVKYPLLFNSDVLFRKAKSQVEHYQRERSPDVPADKYIVTGSGERFAKCDEQSDLEVSEDFSLISKNGREVRALQRRETRRVVQEANLRASVQRGFPVPIRGRYATVKITKIKIDQARGVVFPGKYPGDTFVVNTERGQEYKAYDSQGRLRARYFQNNRILGQLLPNAFPEDRTMVDDAEKTLEEWLENIPGTIPARADGVIRRKEYTFKTLFAEGTEAKEWEGVGRLEFGGVSYRRAIGEQIIEQWKGGGSPEGDTCTCNRYNYSKRVWQREQEEISATEVSPFNTDQMYTDDVPFYRMGALQLQAVLSETNEDSVPPAWETLEPECPTCTIPLKGEATFSIASVSPYRKRELYFSASTLTSDVEAQHLARLLGTLQHQRYRARSITMPLPNEYLIEPTPFRQIHCHRGVYVMDSPSLNMATDGLELSFRGNYVGNIPQVPDPPPIQVWIPDESKSSELQIAKIQDHTVEQQLSLSVELQAFGGNPPYVFSVQGLPDGLGLQGSLIFGISTETGTYPVTVQVIDSQGLTQQHQFNLIISAQALPSPELLVQSVIPVVAIHEHENELSDADPFAPEVPKPIEVTHDHRVMVLQIIPTIHRLMAVHQTVVGFQSVSWSGVTYEQPQQIPVVTHNSAIDEFSTEPPTPTQGLHVHKIITQTVTPVIHQSEVTHQTVTNTTVVTQVYAVDQFAPAPLIGVHQHQAIVQPIRPIVHRFGISHQIESNLQILHSFDVDHIANAILDSNNETILDNDGNPILQG